MPLTSNRVTGSRQYVVRDLAEAEEGLRSTALTQGQP